MADEKEAAGEPASRIVELPASSSWSPEQALAAAAKVDWADLVIAGHNERGDLKIFTSRVGPGDELLIAKEIELDAMGIGIAEWPSS
ncbi:hypothetical protein [Hypericibacter sp.]|uniref:hypothetical protein n=1 Tax=Hypericibacter sp. TaxID=2705401 RepID=UPI003D6C8CDC